jgi:hypothetical protein
VTWLVNDRLPFSTADSEHFANFLASLVGDKFKLPHGTTLCRNDLQSLYDSALIEVKALLAKGKHFTILTDGLTDKFNSRPYETLSVSLSVGWVKYTINLATRWCEEHDAEGLSSWTKEVLAQFNLRIPQVWAATTDTTNVMPAYVRDMGLFWMPCCAHLLNLVGKDATAASEGSSVFFRKVQYLVKFFKKSPQVSNALVSHLFT